MYGYTMRVWNAEHKDCISNYINDAAHHVCSDVRPHYPVRARRFAEQGDCFHQRDHLVVLDQLVVEAVDERTDPALEFSSVNLPAKRHGLVNSAASASAIATGVMYRAGGLLSGHRRNGQRRVDVGCLPRHRLAQPLAAADCTLLRFGASSVLQRAGGGEVV